MLITPKFMKYVDLTNCSRVLNDGFSSQLQNIATTKSTTATTKCLYGKEATISESSKMLKALAIQKVWRDHNTADSLP
jgi:hypothetical protein